MEKISANSVFVKDLTKECERIDFSKPIGSEEKVKFSAFISTLHEVEEEMQKNSAKRNAGVIDFDEYSKLYLLGRVDYTEIIDQGEIVFRHLFSDKSILMNSEDELELALNSAELADFVRELCQQSKERQFPFSLWY